MKAKLFPLKGKDILKYNLKNRLFSNRFFPFFSHPNSKIVPFSYDFFPFLQYTI